MSYVLPPSTPFSLKAPSAASSPSTLSMLSPSGQSKANQLKRKASDLSQQSPPAAAGSFLKWRLSVIQAELDALESMYDDLSTSLTDPTKDHQQIQSAIQHIESERTDLEREFTIVSKQKPFIREDLEDSTKAIEDSYVEDIYTTWLLASEEGQKSFKSSSKRAMPRNKFRKVVADYLDAREKSPEGALQQISCNVLGYMDIKLIKCAHIVPFCFASTELSYMFGAADSALQSPRNGLFFHHVIEKGFDNGWIAIVPDGSVEKTPTEWKIVLLNDAVRNDIVYRVGKTSIVRWRDLDNKPLQFQNEKRPARRYLYFRYVMAHMKATRNGYPGIEKKLPSGEIWASPDKPNGYLRKSVLQSLAKRIGDKPLPTDLVEAGTFEDTDPASGRQIDDLIAGHELSHRIKENGAGSLKDEEDKDEDEYEDEDEDMSD
ncbi:MAG: hypothetical protein Q9223_002702 [Gallowayella weberi]